MILCISANPAIDRRLYLDQLRSGQVNRARSAIAAPGGKAAHVAMAAQALGAETTWLGFLGGTTGDECERGLSSLGIKVVPVRTRSHTRTNLEIIDSAGRITEVLEPGGIVQPDEVRELCATCERLWVQHRDEAQVVISGSLPPGAPPCLYAQIIRMAHAHGSRASLDTSGEALIAALASEPDFVKPNRDEAAWALGCAVRDERTAVAAARRLIACGARSAAISLGADGLLWLSGAEAAPIIAQPPAVNVRSTVGCGDAVMAGFAMAAARGLPAEAAVRLAVACGAANCLADLPGRIEVREVNRIEPLVMVRPVGEGEKINAG